VGGVKVIAIEDPALIERILAHVKPEDDLPCLSVGATFIRLSAHGVSANTHRRAADVGFLLG
jgi:hypothetical protein